MLILNLCDVNDDAENIYYKELLKYYTESQIFSHKCNYSAHSGELILALMGNKYDLIIGHGFGGLLALVIGRITGVKTILINPMYPASRYWDEFYPEYEYKSFLEHITDFANLIDAEQMQVLERGKKSYSDAVDKVHDILLSIMLQTHITCMPNDMIREATIEDTEAAVELSRSRADKKVLKKSLKINKKYIMQEYNVNDN